MRKHASLLICCSAASLSAQTASPPRDSTARTLPSVLIRADAPETNGYAATRSRTGTKTHLLLRDTPQSVSVVTRALVADQGMQSMADVARFLPGVTMGQGEGHRDAPTIRGNSTTADFFVDGLRDDAQYFRDLYNVEQVESLRGSNAMLFGRGGGGGVINRVSKTADRTYARSAVLEGGARDHKRVTLDVGQPVSSSLAARWNGLYQNSGSFRDHVRLRRYGINPTASWRSTAARMELGYEYFDDSRTVDRGVPSFNGRPADARIVSFFGDPDSSYSSARVNVASALFERALGPTAAIRNRTRVVHYDKFYQNVYPGALDAGGARVSLSAYNNATSRTNAFNQTEASFALGPRDREHLIVVGAEFGAQSTDNFRETGYFNGGTATSITAPFDQPSVSATVAFRQSASDADNHSRANSAAVYVQDVISLSSRLRATLGVRAERFDLDFSNRRDGAQLGRLDKLMSPRAGIVFKPATPLSLYASYSVSHLPSSGDQFSSLNVTTQALEPERFENVEVGAKWDVHARLALTLATYELNRENTAARDPNDPARTVQTGRQRSSGYEATAMGAVTSRWQVASAVSLQRARILDATTAARAGATVPLVPHTLASVWSAYRIAPMWTIALGVIHQGDMYAAIDNAVTLPGFSRVDGALYFDLNAHVRLQLNLENTLDRRYFSTSHGNNNILPGAPRTARLVLSMR